MKGLWVLPEHQRSSAGFLVLRAAIAGITEPSLALVREPAAIRLFQALKFTDLGRLPNRLRVLNPGSVLGRLDVDALGLDGLPPWLRTAARAARLTAPVLGPLADVAGVLWAGIATGPLGGVTVDAQTELDRNEVDRLWRDAREEIAGAPARDGNALAGRYLRNAGYEFLHARLRDRLVGVGILKRPRAEGDPRLYGVRLATLSDLLYRPSDPRAGLAILRGAERRARALGADAILCGASATAIDPLLTRRGFLPLPPNLHVLARFPRDVPAPSPGIGDWWFTRGDSEGDGSF
jgi:hypothetical protein